MNILIVAIGSQGDVNPFIKTGMALQKRWHDVSIPSILRPAKLDGLWMPHWMPRFYKMGVWQLIEDQMENLKSMQNKS